MATRLLQANLRHDPRAEDLFQHTLADRDIGLGIAAEPYRVPPGHPCIVGDSPGGVGSSVAVHWRKTDNSPPFSVLERGVGFVAVQWGSIAVIGCYAPPSWTLAQFQVFLDRVGSCARRHSNRPVLVAGDFNAHSRLWGSRRTTGKGREIEEWTVALSLCIINRGSESTFVGPMGESIVDLTFANAPAARLIEGWRVATEMETKSDHLYIEMVLVATPEEVLSRRRSAERPRRWALNKLDEDALMAALIASSWTGATQDIEWSRGEVEREVEELDTAMEAACDASMPRSRPLPRRAAYWWTEEIAELRRSSVKARRAYTVARRGRDDARVAQTRAVWSGAQRVLGAAISKAKAQAWEELISTLNKDPWGRPYRIVMRRLRPVAPPPTQSLSPQFLDEVVETLFPRGVNSLPPHEVSTTDWDEDWDVSSVEMGHAVKRLGAKGKAPGPDGVPGRVWAKAMGILGDRVQRLLTGCLRARVFPSMWKRATLVLLHKEGKAEDSPSAYRPICLLDEAGKFFERIIARRLVRHLSREGPDLHGSQFGFREGRSTVDAIVHVRSLLDAAVREGRVTLAMSLDIANAFNSLPWDRIEEGLRHHRVPLYLVEVIRDYFRGRNLSFLDKQERQRGRGVECGVPQGSVLGPLLWNIAYDKVLRTILPPGCSVVCYADDTFIVAGGKGWEEALHLGQLAADQVVHSIQSMGLRVSPLKTEIVWMHDGSRGAPPEAVVRIGNVPIKVGPTMKYLGLTLDGQWGFEEHFNLLAPKLGRVANALGSLMPNIGGPKGSVRRLYAGVVNSVALYGSPVWVGEAMASRPIKAHLWRAQRWVAIRLTRAYRTTSREAATALAGVPPMELLALKYSEVYRSTRALMGRDRTNVAIARAFREAQKSALRRLYSRWEAQLEVAESRSGRRVAEAIRPCLQEWVGRAYGELSFWTTQVLTGHGCFGEYLHRIDRECTPRCHHCDAEVDSAQHTLAVCPAWDEERRVLTAVVGADLSLPALIRAMVEDRTGWSAVSSFCGTVMSRKEEAERLRRGELTLDGEDEEGRPRRRIVRRNRRPPPAHRRGMDGVAAGRRGAVPAPPVVAPAPPPDNRPVPYSGPITRARARNLRLP